MKKINLEIFLNNFYQEIEQINNNKKIISRLKIIYGLNIYSIIQICSLMKIKYNIDSKYLSLMDWKIFYLSLKEIFNFSLFELKLKNIKKIKLIKNYKAWRHIFNLPVRGQRNHTNAKTRKRFRIV